MRIKIKDKIKGQAAAELAIFGTLIILAFSVLLMYGQRLELQQQAKMEAFRKALQKAYMRNSSVSYTLKKDARFANLFGGYGQGQAAGIGASASVMWVKGTTGLPDSYNQQQFSYYQVNDEMIGEAEFSDGDIFIPRYKKLSTGYDGSEQEITVSANIWKEVAKRTENYQASTKKEEAGSGITNTKSSDLQETVELQGNVRLDKANNEPWDDNPIPQYVYEGQSYDVKGDTYTVRPVNPVIQGAYLNEETNRIEYNKDNLGTTVHRERTWTTVSQDSDE
jgi:hypothetical protein